CRAVHYRHNRHKNGEHLRRSGYCWGFVISISDTRFAASKDTTTVVPKTNGDCPLVMGSASYLRDQAPTRANHAATDFEGHRLCHCPKHFLANPAKAGDYCLSTSSEWISKATIFLGQRGVLWI